MTAPEALTPHDLATLPKVELHVHLGGTLTVATASQLARRHGEEPARVLRLEDGRYPPRYPDFRGFLDAYVASNALVRTPEDLELVAAQFARTQAAQGIVYSEVLFTALTYTRNGIEANPMWAALRQGLAAAGPATRIGVVVDAIRDLGPAEAVATLQLLDDADAPIVGLSLTGIEETMPIEEFVTYRTEARRRGLGFEVHAGEMGPPRSVRETLDILEPDRIGHGVAVSRDVDLLDRVVRERVVLEVCPSSNVAIGLYPSLEEHPVATLWDAGVEMTISSDDPPFFGTTLVDELRSVARLAGLGREDVAELQRRAARHSFADEETKATLVAAIDAWAAARPDGRDVG